MHFLGLSVIQVTVREFQASTLGLHCCAPCTKLVQCVCHLRLALQSSNVAPCKSTRLSEEFMDQQIYAMQNSGLCPQSLEFCSPIRTTGFSHHVLLGCCRKPVGTQAQSPGTLPSSLSGRMALSLAGQALPISLKKTHVLHLPVMQGA